MSIIPSDSTEEACLSLNNRSKDTTSSDSKMGGLLCLIELSQ